MNQTDSIISHLKSGKSITPLDALELYGCFRLGARINDLRKEGFNIKTEIIHRNGKHFASYRMEVPTPEAYKVQAEILFSASF